MNEQGEACARLSLQLGALSVGDVAPPRVRVSLFLADAHELLRVVDRPAIQERLRSVGVSVEQLANLGLAIDALREAEARRIAERRASRSRGGAKAEERALWLREEMRQACRFNLREQAPAGAFERITVSDDCAELICDLRELCQLITENAVAFELDRSFDAEARAYEAECLIEELSAEYSPGTSPDPTRSRPAFALELNASELRDRAYSYLQKLSADIREAGAYAYRDEPQKRRLFVSGCPSNPPAPSLRSTIRALVG